VGSNAPRRWQLAIRLLEQTRMDVSEVGAGRGTDCALGVYWERGKDAAPTCSSTLHPRTHYAIRGTTDAGLVPALVASVRPGRYR
jgi:hypothetical protein